MKNNKLKRLQAVLACAAVCSLGASASNAAATIVINNINAAGVGFNDPTPAAPVGGNSGTTLGQQRLIAFAAAANQWGATITSSVPITINAQFTPLTCTATGAVLGSAGATTIHRDFTNAPRAATWYSQALANKLFGADLATANADINANFNSNLGQPGCLTGTFFYLGLDNNHGASIDFYTVLLHEMGHGLGFQTFTNGTTGNYQSGFPSIWDHFLVDNTTGLSWVNSTAAQRAASAIGINHLVWTGTSVTANASVVLRGTPRLIVGGVAAGGAAGAYALGPASFGAPLTNTGVSGDIMPVTGGNGEACAPLSALDTLAVKGNVALVVRGTCGFVVKVLNAQNAGAIGVIVQDNVAGSPPPGLGGTDPAITIPSGRVTLADGNIIRTALARRSRTKSGVTGTLGLNAAQLAGADSLGRLLMYTPNPFQGGSSVSHYDVSANPNLLMEPAINGDLTHSNVVPQDLTYSLLLDIGW